ncbi:dynein regulatory complex protein 1 isoform X2 [Protopterus annectens]|uniref:dynein regulatory complex protein 1 isoform X2 n=1 Tax=Protopterus annectens TaxID=7888 RepID=UPI001CFB486D|nr:dynein regulatory complex protein 1 isoform X2 [Protopterus annectens]
MCVRVESYEKQAEKEMGLWAWQSACRHELRSKDDQYVKELKKEAEDIDLLIERMEEQIKSLTKCYSTELHQIERAFELERRELLADNQQKWEQMMQERRDKELEYLTTRMRKVEEYEQLLKQLRVQDAEEYNMIKIKLETEVQILEQQLQQMKATYQLNQEKLEYNFQVLKKRDEENTITKSQQKRKITRLQDILNKLKIKFDKQVKQYQEDNQALTDDYKRITEQYKELQKKMRHFAVVDTRKFYEIWIMNEEEIKQLAQKAFEVDRLIHEQQLGLPWIMPEFWFMENMGPVIPQYKKKKSAVQLAEEVMFSAASQVVVEDSKTHSYQTSASQQIKGKMDSEDSGHRSDSSTVSRPTLKMLLELLCDESGFLIESKLLKLLLPLERDEQSLLKLDAVFQALGIENEDDVYKLAEFLIRYKEQQQSDDQDRDEEKEALLQEEVYPGQEELSSDAHMEGKRKPLLFRPYASNLIHPDDVLKAVRAFVTEHQKQRERTHQTKLVNLDERDDTEDAAYWEAIANVIPSSKVKVWEALLSAMEKHHHILTERSTLITETDSLKQQNTELRMLLHQYINSTVTAQLEIPPMQTVQMQFSQT